METYSTDLRERVVQACDEQHGTRERIARLFGVSTAWIRRLLQRRRESGTIAPKPHGGGRPAKYSGKRLDRLKELVEQQPDATLVELRDRSGVAASIMAVHRALERLDSRLKKSPSTPASKIDRASKRSGRHGGSGRSPSIRRGSSSSMKAGPKPT
jgi:transposase